MHKVQATKKKKVKIMSKHRQMREYPLHTWRDSENLRTTWQRVWQAQAMRQHRFHSSLLQMTTTAHSKQS